MAEESARSGAGRGARRAAQREAGTPAVAPSQSRLGPRGGLTTVTPGGLNRVSAYLVPEEREALRRRAFEEDVSISEVIREAIRAYLDLP